MKKTERSVRTKRQIKPSDLIFHGINITFFAFFTFICAYPLYYVIINSLSDNQLVAAGMVRLFPKGFNLQNYENVMKINGLAEASLTSVARTVLGTLFMLGSSTFLGYAMTRPEYWCRKFWYRYLIITMYFGAGLIPGFLNIKRLGLMNSFWVYVLPAVVAPYNMILIKTYIENIPDSLEEAAIMDGAGYLVRILRIILPLSKPIIATVCVFTAVGQWNSYMDTVLYMTKGDYQTLQSILYTYLNKANALASIIKSGGNISNPEMLNQLTPAAVRYTVTAIVMVPVLLIYPFFQRYFTKGIMIGAVKG